MMRMRRTVSGHPTKAARAVRLTSLMSVFTVVISPPIVSGRRDA